jgi:hypothetical protein
MTFVRRQQDTVSHLVTRIDFNITMHDPRCTTTKSAQENETFAACLLKPTHLYIKSNIVGRQPEQVKTYTQYHNQYRMAWHQHVGSQCSIARIIIITFVQNEQVERRHMSASEELAGSSTAYSPTGSIAEVGSSDSPFLPWYVPHHHHDPALAQCKLKMKRDGRRGRRRLACWEAEQETQSLSSTSGTLTDDKHWQHNTVLF